VNSSSNCFEVYKVRARVVTYSGVVPASSGPPQQPRKISPLDIATGAASATIVADWVYKNFIRDDGKINAQLEKWSFVQGNLDRAKEGKIGLGEAWDLNSRVLTHKESTKMLCGIRDSSTHRLPPDADMDEWNKLGGDLNAKEPGRFGERFGLLDSPRKLAYKNKPGTVEFDSTLFHPRRTSSVSEGFVNPKDLTNPSIPFSKDSKIVKNSVDFIYMVPVLVFFPRMSIFVGFIYCCFFTFHLQKIIIPVVHFFYNIFRGVLITMVKVIRYRLPFWFSLQTSFGDYYNRFPEFDFPQSGETFILYLFTIFMFATICTALAYFNNEVISFRYRLESYPRRLKTIEMGQVFLKDGVTILPYKDTVFIENYTFGYFHYTNDEMNEYYHNFRVALHAFCLFVRVLWPLALHKALTSPLNK